MWMIKLTCYDADKPYFDKVDKRFEQKGDADKAMLCCVLNELRSLNEPDVDFSPRRVYLPDLHPSGVKHDALISFWTVGEESEPQPLTGYDVIALDDPGTEKYNQMLRERHGECITVVIKHDEERDDFYYTSSYFGESDHYATAENAYKEANDYLENIDLYVD